MRRVGRQHCAVFQCIEEQGLASCGQCAEAPCAFHEHLSRVCPAGQAPVARPGESWRLKGLSPGGAGLAREPGRPRSQIPDRTITRLRWYLAALAHFSQAGMQVVSSADIAVKVGVSSSLVRRDLCCFGQFGTPSLGYHVDDLHAALSALFEVEGPRWVAWVGAPRLARDPGALAQFAEHDWEVIAIFDPDPEQAGTSVAGPVVMHISSAGEVLPALAVNTAVLAVPEDLAQETADELEEAGITAILNLTEAPLALPSRVAVQQADLATQLMLLSYFARLAREAEKRRAEAV
jgi:redox-sensing transcriptional repressor